MANLHLSMLCHHCAYSRWDIFTSLYLSNNTETRVASKSFHLTNPIRTGLLPHPTKPEVRQRRTPIAQVTAPSNPQFLTSENGKRSWRKRVICDDLTYELDGFFKVLFQILTATVWRLQTFARQPVFKVKGNVCSNVKYVSDSKFLQRLEIGGVTFISYTE